jgi:hypothetical protein
LTPSLPRAQLTGSRQRVFLFLKKLFAESQSGQALGKHFSFLKKKSLPRVLLAWLSTNIFSFFKKKLFAESLAGLTLGKYFSFFKKKNSLPRAGLSRLSANPSLCRVQRSLHSAKLGHGYSDSLVSQLGRVQ